MDVKFMMHMCINQDIVLLLSCTNHA